MAGLTIACIALGALVDRAARERRAAEWLTARGFHICQASHAPAWMPDCVGEHFFMYGVMVDNTNRGPHGKAPEWNRVFTDPPRRLISNIEMYLLFEQSQGSHRDPPFAVKLTGEMSGHLAELRDCRVLSLRQATSSDDGFRCLRRLRKLEYLNLSGGNVSDDDLRHMAGMTNMQYLYLSATGVTDAGLRHLANLSNLRTLNLDATAVSDDGIKYLKHLRALYHIDLCQTQVTARGLHALAQALPECSISIDEQISVNLSATLP